MKRSVYLFSKGKLVREKNTLCFYTQKNKKNKSYIPVENIQEILAFGEVEFNKKMLEFLSYKSIILHYFTYSGKYLGTFYPEQYHSSGSMILNQSRHYLDNDTRIELAQKFVLGSQKNILKLLAYYENRGYPVHEIKKIKTFTPAVQNSLKIEKLLTLEARIRGFYYSCFDSIINDSDFLFEKRSKRPPENRLNALISFGNTLLYSTVTTEIYKTALDPRFGFLHASNHRFLSLNLDIAEIFKPVLVDRTIFTLIHTGQLDKNDFTDKNNGVYLNEQGRRVFVEKWDETLKSKLQPPGMNRKISFRGLIHKECQKLEKHFLGEKLYQPYVYTHH